MKFGTASSCNALLKRLFAENVWQWRTLVSESDTQFQRLSFHQCVNDMPCQISLSLCKMRKLKVNQLSVNATLAISSIRSVCPDRYQ